MFKRRNTRLVTLYSGNSPSTVGTTATAAVKSFSIFESIKIFGSLLGNAGGTLDVYVQHSVDGVDFYDLVHFKQVAIGGPAVIWNLSPAQNDYIVQVGKNLSPLLAEHTSAGAPWMDQMRVVWTTGAGTVTGAAQSIFILGTCDEP